MGNIGMKLFALCTLRNQRQRVQRRNRLCRRKGSRINIVPRVIDQVIDKGMTTRNKCARCANCFTKGPHYHRTLLLRQLIGINTTQPVFSGNPEGVGIIQH